MNDLKKLQEITSNYSILYVEDDKDIAKTLINYLSKFFKEVVYAQDGEQGLELYQQDTYEIVLSDINMPKMTGLEMAAKIRELNKHQNIIIVSAYSEVENFLESIRIGIDGYIIKPVDYTQMNNLLYRTALKIKAFKENKEYENRLETLVKQIAKKNGELKNYTDLIDKVSIVSKTDLKGNITYVNDAFCEVSGYTKEELIGNQHNIIRHKDMSKSVYQELWETIQGGKIWEGTLKNRAKDGSAYYVHAVIAPVFQDDNETIEEYVGIRFLTTDEEVEKREFKKKVMTNNMEFKKTYFNSVERIAELEKEVELLKNVDHTHQHESDGYKAKYKQALSQVNFYEKEMKRLEERHHKMNALTKENVDKVSSSHKTALQRIDRLEKQVHKYKEDESIKSKEIVRLNEQLNEQFKVIHNLRDVVKNSNDEIKKSKTKKGLFDSWTS